MAHALTPEHDVDIAVYRADTGGRITDEQPSNPAFFMARLPATLGYLVLLRSTGDATPYTLEIEVPFRLFFDQTRSVEVTNSAPANAVIEYLAPPSKSDYGRADECGSGRLSNGSSIGRKAAASG